MKNKILLLVCVLNFNIQSQTNLVTNGGFETYINTNCGCKDYYVCNATGWYMLNNTPDVAYTGNTLDVSGGSFNPRTGQG